MDLIKWDPFHEMQQMQKDFGRWLGFPTKSSAATLDRWLPAVDILEDENEIVIKLETPEVDKKDIQITVENDTLTISGERKLEHEDKQDRYHRIERAYGAFSRSFTLPETVDQTKIAAENKNGVLRLTLKKNPEPKPQTVSILVE